VNESQKAPINNPERAHDVPPSEIFSEFMKSGWLPTPLDGVVQDEVIQYCVNRRAQLSDSFIGTRLVIPSGSAKQRSNDTIISIGLTPLLLITPVYKVLKLNLILSL